MHAAGPPPPGRSVPGARRCYRSGTALPVLPAPAPSGATPRPPPPPPPGLVPSDPRPPRCAQGGRYRGVRGAPPPPCRLLPRGRREAGGERGSCPHPEGREGWGGAAPAPRYKGMPSGRAARRGASGAGTEEGGRNLGEEKGERPRRRSPSLNRVNGSAAQGEEGAPAGSRAEALGGAGPPPRELRDPLGQRHAKVGPRSPLALGRVRSPLFAEMRRVSRGSAGGPAGETSVGFPARAVSTAHVSAERSSPREGLFSRQRCLFSIRPPPNGISSALAPRCCSARCDLTGDGTGAEREKKTFDSSSSELF